jgi:hypothetical protein
MDVVRMKREVRGPLFMYLLGMQCNGADLCFVLYLEFYKIYGTISSFVQTGPQGDIATFKSRVTPSHTTTAKTSSLRSKVFGT